MAKTVIQMVSGRSFDFNEVPIETITKGIEDARKMDSKQLQLNVDGNEFGSLKTLVLYVDHIEAVYVEE